MDIPKSIFKSSFTIKVKPNTKKTEITKVKDNIIHLNVKAPAEANKANIDVIKFFTKLLKKKVKIVKGLTSREKVLKIIE